MAEPTSSSVYNTNLPEYAQPYVETMLGSGQKELFNYDAPDGGPGSLKGYQPFNADPRKYFADFTDLQNKSFTGAGNLGPASQLQQGTGLASLAGNAGFDNNTASQYMNPYFQQAMQPQMREAMRNSEMMRNQQQAQAVGQGAFGGSRQGLVEAERQRNLGMQLGDIQSQGYNTAFNQAQQQFNADQARRIQSANALGALGQTQFGQQQAAIGLQNQLGSQQQQYEQNIKNQQVQDYAMAKQYPMQQLASMNALLRGLPLQSTTVQNYQAPPSPLSQIGGLGMAAYGAYGLANPEKKAAAGGLINDNTRRPAGLAELALSLMS
jgi:hypothetical protein